MTRFILLTFGFLGWAWYEMSGGAAYRAGTAAEPAVAQAPRPEVARAETGAADLTSVAQARAASPKPDVTRVSAAAETAKTIDPVPMATVDVAAARVDSDAAPAAPELGILPDLRQVTGGRVNMRNGPGTGFSVVWQLRRGETVEVLSDPGQGWVKLKVVESDRVGWMSDDFLRIVLN